MGTGPAPAVAGLITLGIVTALPGEARILARRRCAPGSSLRLTADVHLQLSGMGSVAARSAAQSLVDRGAGALLSWGCAGGLDPALAAGSLLLPTRVACASGEYYAVDDAWHVRLMGELIHPANTGLLLTSERPLTSKQDKVTAHAQTRAVAVDMESAAVAAVAREHALPFVAVRALADGADTDVPAAALQALSARGGFQAWALLRSLAGEPGQLPKLLRLAQAFRSAQATLAAAAARVGPRLCAP